MLLLRTTHRLLLLLLKQRLQLKQSSLKAF
jgi:hypothetical protein